MLGLLLFAGALHVKLSDLRREWVVVMLMATIGIGLSTVIVGIGFSWLTGMPLLIALLFGALISPTDPVSLVYCAKPTLKSRLKQKSQEKACLMTALAMWCSLCLSGSRSHTVMRTAAACPARRNCLCKRRLVVRCWDLCLAG